MNTGERQEQYEGWVIVDIFKLMLATFKNNFAGMMLILVFYGALAVVVNWAFSGEAVMRTLLIGTAAMSIISVLRTAFENGKLKPDSALPRFAFILKIFLSLIVIAAVIALLCFIFVIISILCGYILKAVFGKTISPDSVYMIAGAIVFVNLLIGAYFSFCFIAFSGKSGLWESFGTAARIFTENKLAVFLIFGILSAAITYLMSSYVVPLMSFYFGHDLSSAKKAAECFGFLSSNVAFVFSALMPLYWMLLMSVYFTLGHEGAVIKDVGNSPVFGAYIFSTRAGQEADEEIQTEESVSDNFSLQDTFYFSWNIYKKLSMELTSGIIAVYAVFISVCAAAFLILRQVSVLPDIFAGKYPHLGRTFICLAAALLVYYALMFLYISYVRGYFRGKGMSFRNFFPALRVSGRFLAFTAFIAAFLLSIPFILEKAEILLRFFTKSYSLPFTPFAAGLSLIFAVIAVYALVSLFYVPVFILDGHTFSDSLNRCTQMMTGQRMAFFSILFLLLLLNAAGHALIIGWIFTVPFSVLAVMQIYSTVSVGYSKYHEDVVKDEE
ncbi:MAG: hypothetical protein FWG57_06155 [Endomicrobia bacterium]|nr:hypothetical protein [Endomicrobiia bacterium]